MWLVVHEGQAQKRRDRLAEKGRAIPDSLKPPPPPYGFESWLLDFFELSNDRPIREWGQGPIPSTSIRAHVAGWGKQEADLFRMCIRQMDGVYLRHVNGVVDAPESDNPARDAFRARMRKAG